MEATQFHRLVVRGAGVLVVAATTGCATLVQSVADELDDGTRPGTRSPSRPDELGLTTSRAAARREETGAVTGDYQAAPTIDWTLYRYGPPFSLSRGLFEPAARSNGRLCRGAPIGLARDWSSWTTTNHIERDGSNVSASAAKPVSEDWRGERELLDNSVRLGTLFEADHNTLTARYIASAGRLSQQGHVCSPSLFLSVWVWGDEAAVTSHR